MRWVSIQKVSEASIEKFKCSDEVRVEEFFKHKAKKYDFEMLARTHVLLDNKENMGSLLCLTKRLKLA